MSTFSLGENAFIKNLSVDTLMKDGKPLVSVTDPLVVNTVQCQTIGSVENPLETMHIGSDIRYQNDIKFIDTQDPLNEREQMSLLTDGSLKVHTSIKFNDFVLNNPVSKSRFSAGLDDLDASFEIKSLDPVEQTRVKIGETGINEITCLQTTINIETLGSGVLINDGPLVLNSGDITLTAGKYRGDGSLLTNLPSGANQNLQSVTDQGNTTTNSISAFAFVGDGSGLTNLPVQPDTSTLQDVTTRGATSDVVDVSYTGTGTMIVNQEKLSGNNLRIESGSGGLGKVSIGEQTQGFTNADHIGDRSIAIGRNALSINNTTSNDTIAIGSGAANNSCGSYAVCIGDDCGQNNCADEAVNIGKYAGEFSAGENSINIGALAGQNSAQSAVNTDNTIVLNASGIELNAGVASSCYIRPIRASPDVSSESLQLYYDSSSNEVRTGAINNGSIGSLSQVLAVGNTGTIMELNELNSASVILSNSLNYAYPSSTNSLTLTSVPLTLITKAYAHTTLPANPLRFTGDVFTFVNNTADTITASTIVMFDDDGINNVNGVQPFNNSYSQSNQNCTPIGVCIQDSAASQSCFVLIGRGFTTCRNANATDNTYVKGQRVKCIVNGEIISAQINAGDSIIGTAMESKVAGAGEGVLIWIRPDFNYFV